MGALLVVALLSAACVAGGDEPAASVSSEPDDGAAPVESNAASFRGVTEDTIRVGVAVPDFAALQQVGVPTLYGDYEVVYQAFFDALNDAGGVHGRMIEPHYATFDWSRPETQDAACTELTEDHEVFMVFGGLLSASNLCFTELHDTMLMTGIFLTEDLKERSGETLWLQTAAIEEAFLEVLARSAAEAGQLEGKKIGIVALGAVAGGGPGEEMQAELADLGYDSTLAVISAPTNDRVAVDAEITSFGHRFMADGVDLVFSVTEGAGVYEPWAALGYDPEIIDRSLPSSVVSSADTSMLDGVYGVSGASLQDTWDDASFEQECADVVLDANPDLAEEFGRQVATSQEQADGLPNWAITVSGACTSTFLFKEIAELAGGDLTNDTFRAALDELGPIERAWGGRMTFSSDDKWDGQDEFRFVRWDEDRGELVTVGDPIVLDR